MRQVFDPDNLLWRIVSKGVDFVGLSFLWALLCVPLVPAGPASAALYYTVVKCLRHGEKGTFGVFFRALRENFRACVPAELLCLGAAAPLYLGYGILRANWGSSLGAVMFVAYDVALVLPLGILCWLFPLLGRFRFTWKEALRTAAMLTLRHIPSTAVVVMLTVELAVFTLERTWPILLTPSLCALLASLFFERIFPKYLSEGEARKLSDTSETPLEEREDPGSEP